MQHHPLFLVLMSHPASRLGPRWEEGPSSEAVLYSSPLPNRRKSVSYKNKNSVPHLFKEMMKIACSLFLTLLTLFHRYDEVQGTFSEDAQENSINRQVVLTPAYPSFLNQVLKPRKHFSGFPLKQVIKSSFKTCSPVSRGEEHPLLTERHRLRDKFEHGVPAVMP